MTYLVHVRLLTTLFSVEKNGGGDYSSFSDKPMLVSKRVASAPAALPSWLVTTPSPAGQSR